MGAYILTPLSKNLEKNSGGLIMRAYIPTNTVYNFSLNYNIKGAKSESNDYRVFTTLGMTYEKLVKNISYKVL